MIKEVSNIGPSLMFTVMMRLSHLSSTTLLSRPATGPAVKFKASRLPQAHHRRSMDFKSPKLTMFRMKVQLLKLSF